ncbi:MULTISPECIES: ribosome small subunit-dependent GTPase A [Paenibacillus]|uniref:Small ribosomal subunit biogenesis GTPase RsgA n=1 Tax=Paenibacillus albilobatus TaxID=2716884 RepID=A0A919XCZ6_9BACL|nr:MULTISPECIES: ribosome small subunit-dependent GTPase A [Paenibacillus]GIO29881.1 putative ribosome biogenesis GTPase RsgA [Paenibacillus albilobatus]
MTKLTQYGWSAYWNMEWSKEDRGIHQPGRITADFGQMYKVYTEEGEIWGEMSGKMKHELQHGGPVPAVGDWVELQMLEGEERGVILGVLDRKTNISRQKAGAKSAQEQLIAANVDILFLVTSLNDDYNPRRMERYLIMAWNSGVNPVILLSKADLCDDADIKAAEMEMIAPGVPVHVVSALENRGKEAVTGYLKEGVTVALTGSSGCGKSTIVNWLAETSTQRTQGIREDDSRGRHTTTHRQLFLLPQGGLMVDTPGMRELQLYDDNGGGFEQAFADIESIGKACRFADCRHEREAGCAVRAAVEAGEIDAKRLQNYRKTQRELEFQMKKEARGQRKLNRMDRSAKEPVRRKSSYWNQRLTDE